MLEGRPEAGTRSRKRGRGIELKLTTTGMTGAKFMFMMGK